MVKVVVDIYGGDYSPHELIKGSVMAVNKHSDIELMLVGKEIEINDLLKQYKYQGNQIKILNAEDVIDNNDTPTTAIRKKTDSSLVKSLEFLKQNDEYSGMVSAGSTGAVLTGAFMKLGRIKGISRPALCPILPTVNDKIVAIIDVGANMDSKPINLHHFAIMGSAYLKALYNIENPKVALLNVGVEDQKGNELTKETYELLKNDKSINFIGNAEARELLSGEFDLIVADGFSGNVLLKSTEGAVKSLLTILKNEITSSFSSKIGYLFMKNSFKRLKKKLDYNDYGGAVFLGVNKIVVKSHGNSKAKSIYESIMQVVTIGNSDIISNITKSVSTLNISEEV